jgi:hypothetical protein
VSPAQGAGGRGRAEQRHGAEGILFLFFFLNVTTAQAARAQSGPGAEASPEDPSLGQVTLLTHGPPLDLHTLCLILSLS